MTTATSQTPAPLTPSSAAAPLIRLDAITKVFYTDEMETHALSEVHLEIREGEYVAIGGPSGCGKTTLLSILGCVLCPTAGLTLRRRYCLLHRSPACHQWQSLFCQLQ